MVQPFCSIYTKSYRWFGKDEEDETAKPCLYFSELKENFRPLEDSKAIYNPERDEAVIKDLHLRRLATTYQTTYCATVGKKSLVIDPDDLEADEFMVFFNNYFKKRTQPIPSPVYTGRRVFGYCRFDDYYTGKSTYEEEISKEAYEYFKKDYDKGWSRLFRKKQLEKHRLRQRGNEEAEVETKRETETEAGKESGKEETSSTGKKKASDVKEKVCAFCCEKFGDFSCNVPSREKNGKPETETEEVKIENENKSVAGECSRTSSN